MIALQAVLVAWLTVTALAQGESSSGFQIRADTLVPTELSVRPDDVECPTGQAVSPVEYRDVGTLADTISLYDGDLIFVRVLARATGAGVDTVDFTLRWPESVVGASGPTCAFVVGDGTDPASISWQNEPSGDTEFTLSSPQVGALTEIELWLTADDPASGDTFRTAISSDFRDDDIVIDPVGGRVQVERRFGSTPDVAIDVDTGVGDGDGPFTATVRVTNPDPTTRALDLLVRVDAPGDPTWTVQDVPDGVECETFLRLECAIGDLAAGRSMEVTASFTQVPDWAPRAVECRSSATERGFGFCVETTVLSLSSEGGQPVTTRALVPQPRPDEALLIRTEPDAVLARAGFPAEFDFVISASGATDLGSVVIVGSDCDTVAREIGDLDDGDSFLELGEAWIYPCEFEVDPTARSFRMDVAAIDQEGEPVTATFEGEIDVISPELTVTVVPSASGAELRVRNSGETTIRNVAVGAPACESLSVAKGDPELLLAGDRLDILCEGTAGVVSRVTAYGTDPLGLGVIASLG